MKTCEHVNARDAPQSASARVGMFASRLSLHSRLSKNNPSPKAWSGLTRIVPIISVKQGRSVSCRGYNIRREEFAGVGESGRDFVSLLPKTTVAADPRKAKNPKLLGVFWGPYYTVIRRDSLSTV